LGDESVKILNALHAWNRQNSQNQNRQTFHCGWGKDTKKTALRGVVFVPMASGWRGWREPSDQLGGIQPIRQSKLGMAYTRIGEIRICKIKIGGVLYEGKR